jgi:hypothetical protein
VDRGWIDGWMDGYMAVINEYVWVGDIWVDVEGDMFK